MKLSKAEIEIIKISVINELDYYLQDDDIESITYINKLKDILKKLGWYYEKD